MALASVQDNYADGAMHYAYGSRTGTRTAADFSLDLGFKPRKIRFINATDLAVFEMYFDSNLDGGSNAKGVKIVDTGAGTTDITYADIGVTLGADERSVDVVVATGGIETDNDDVLWEAWG